MSLNHQHGHCTYDSHQYWPHKIWHNQNRFPFRIQSVSNKRTCHQGIWIWSNIADNFCIHSRNMTRLLFWIEFVERVRSYRSNHLEWFCNHTIVLKIILSSSVSKIAILWGLYLTWICSWIYPTRMTLTRFTIFHWSRVEGWSISTPTMERATVMWIAHISKCKILKFLINLLIVWWRCSIVSFIAAFQVWTGLQNVKSLNKDAQTFLWFPQGSNCFRGVPRSSYNRWFLGFGGCVLNKSLNNLEHAYYCHRRSNYDAHKVLHLYSQETQYQYIRHCILALKQVFIVQQDLEIPSKKL